MAIYKVDGGYVISSHHVWMPGCYDSERTANYAFRFTDETLQGLQNEKIALWRTAGQNKEGPYPITYENLKNAREDDRSIKKSWNTK